MKLFLLFYVILHVGDCQLYGKWFYPIFHNNYYYKLNSNEVLCNMSIFIVISLVSYLVYIHIYTYSVLVSDNLVSCYVDRELGRISGTIRSFPCRKDSMARIHSLTIEAPITKVCFSCSVSTADCSDNSCVS